MKKSLLSLSALALAFTSSMAIPSAAQAKHATGPEAVQMCEAIIDIFTTESLGHCVAFFRAAPESFAGRDCGVLERQGAFDGDGAMFSNQGECVTFIRSLG
jgi:hypothetical protein